MKKTQKKLSLHSNDQNSTALILISAGFILGGIFGCVFARSVSGDGSLALSAYILDFISAIRDGSIQMPGVLTSAWSVLRWPLITILLSFSVIGIIGIPILFFIRGFLLTFCISSFVQVLGKMGLIFAFMLLGVQSLLSIPVLFLFGMQAILLAAQAREKKNRTKRPIPFAQNPSTAFRNTICVFVLIFCVVWEIFFVPMLLSGASNLFPT